MSDEVQRWRTAVTKFEEAKAIVHDLGCALADGLDADDDTSDEAKFFTEVDNCLTQMDRLSVQLMDCLDHALRNNVPPMRDPAETARLRNDLARRITRALARRMEESKSNNNNERPAPIGRRRADNVRPASIGRFQLVRMRGRRQLGRTGGAQIVRMHHQNGSSDGSDSNSSDDAPENDGNAIARALSNVRWYDDLPTRIFSEAEAKAANYQCWCQICLSPVAIGEIIRTLTCFHAFHVDCVDPWLENNTTCPSCRTNQLSEEDDEDDEEEDEEDDDEGGTEEEEEEDDYEEPRSEAPHYATPPRVLPLRHARRSSAAQMAN